MKQLKYKNTNLILDNFRSVLCNFSVDIQDIVRSAILDGVDISKYIDSCRDNPYRLDQIRLAKKQGISDTIFKLQSGECIYRVRQMQKKGNNLKDVESQLFRSTLTEEYALYMLKWIDEGIDLHGLNVSTIPQKLLGVFDYGLRSGFNMTLYNRGVVYTSEYVRLCLQIQGNNKNVSFLLNGKWSEDVLRLLVSFSKVNQGVWDNLVNYILSDISSKRLEKLISLVKSNINIEILQERIDNRYVFSDECLDLVYSAYISGLDYKKLISTTHSWGSMKKAYDLMELDKRKKVSGRLRKN